MSTEEEPPKPQHNDDQPGNSSATQGTVSKTDKTAVGTVTTAEKGVETAVRTGTGVETATQTGVEATKPNNPSKETETGGAAKPMKDNTTASTANNEQKDASTQVEVEPEEGKKVATVAPIASTPWITVQLGRAVDPRWMWTQTCPWGRSPNPPTDFYSQGQDPLGSLKNKIHYVPLGTIVSMYDQDHIRSEILEQWQPRKGVRVDHFILWLRDHIRVQVQGIFGLINENRQDHWVRRLLQVHWKVAKEDVRLAVKIRYRGALHELEAMLARKRQPTWQEVDLVTKLLWWPSNIRHE